MSAPSGVPNGVEAFEKVKLLLLGETERRLDDAVERLGKIDARVGDRKKFAATAGDAMVDALKHAEEKRHRDVSSALAPFLVSVIRSEIKNSKEMLIEALYPIMGRLVTASVAGAFRDLIESLNARIDGLVSANSWRLRLRALMTGRTMAEVALAEAEAGRLKRALLLERGSGRLLAMWPEKDRDADGGNADLESGMIAAITEFAANVYADQGGELRMLDIGSGRVFLRASPRVIVAGECGGALPRLVERRLDDAFLDIVERYEKDEAACGAEEIGALLDGAMAAPAQMPLSKAPVIVFGLAMAALAIWFAWNPVLHGWRERRIRAAYETAMAEHPALAQYPLHLDIDHGDGTVVLRGLAANETDPQAVVEAIAGASEPYRAMRDIAAVAPAAQVETLRGELDRTRAALERLMAEQETPRAKLRRFVDSFAVFFTASDTLLDPTAAAAGVDELASLLKASGGGLRVVGYADEVGGAAPNRVVSRKRAEKVVAMLIERGAPRDQLVLVARSTSNPLGDPKEVLHSRRVSFEMPFDGEFNK
jgi:outer membrane protein OmpA-like peptidoglycan-associated protein